MILIDMEMPTGELGAIPVMIYADGCVEHFFSHEKLGIAVPVQPNGDLIDRNALKDAICSRLCIKSMKYLSPAEETIVNEINNAPTVIPASEEET